MELFQLLGTIAIENDAANKSIDDTTGKAEQSENKISSAFKKVGAVVAGAFAVDKIKEFGLSCVEAAADVKATNSQFEQVFGNMKEQASASLSKIADDTGIIETRMKGSYTQIAAFAKTTGMDTADSLDLANRSMLAVADSAAYYDRSLEETTESLQSFLKGNYENDAALGLSCTETTRNAAANKLYGKSCNDLSESQKQLTLLQMVEDANKLSGALGQAARESDGWENVTGNLNEAWKNFQATIGAPVLAAVVPIIQKATDGLAALGEKTGEVIKWAKEHEKAVQAVAGALEVAAAAMVAFKAGAAIQSVIKSFQEAKLAIALFSMSTEGATVAQGLLNGTLTIGEGIVALLTGKMTLAQLAQAGMAKGQAALNAVMSANPIGIVIALIVALVAAFVVLWNKSEGFRNFWISIWDGMKEFAALAVDGIKAAIETLKQVFDSIPEKLGAVKDSAIEKFGAIKDSISEKLETAKGAITEKLEAIKNDTSQKLNAIKQAYDSHGGGIKGAMSAALEGVKQIAKTGYDGLNSLTGGKLGDVANTFKNKLSNLKQTTQDAFEKVKSTVKSGIDKIKGFFNFNWKLPKIKLPHFSISGKFSLDPPSIPSFGVEWYKQGGIMTKPTAFGIDPMTGNTMIGGEAGAEAIAPIDKLKQYIQEAISEVTPDEPKNIQNNFTFNSPKAINAKEAARLFKKQLTNIQLGY